MPKSFAQSSKKIGTFQQHNHYRNWISSFHEQSKITKKEHWDLFDHLGKTSATIYTSDGFPWTMIEWHNFSTRTLASLTTAMRVAQYATRVSVLDYTWHPYVISKSLDQNLVEWIKTTQGISKRKKKNEKLYIAKVCNICINLCSARNNLWPWFHIQFCKITLCVKVYMFLDFFCIQIFFIGIFAVFFFYLCKIFLEILLFLYKFIFFCKKYIEINIFLIFVVYIIHFLN